MPVSTARPASVADCFLLGTASLFVLMLCSAPRTAHGASHDAGLSGLGLVDGRSVCSPLFAGTFGDTQDAMLEDVERIEVVREPGAVTWGSNAVNGVINIITKRATGAQGGLSSVTYGLSARRAAISPDSPPRGGYTR